MSHSKLELVGALFVQSVAHSTLPSNYEKLVLEARGELTEELDTEQFELYTEAGHVGFYADHEFDDDGRA